MNEVQVICTVISADKEQDPDIAAMLGASAALAGERRRPARRLRRPHH